MVRSVGTRVSCLLVYAGIASNRIWATRKFQLAGHPFGNSS
jgi:hypothetical protein